MNGENGSRRLPEHVSANREFWDGMAHEWVTSGEREWSREEPVWGIWHIPDRDVQLLPTDMHGQDAIELGCGTAYVASWMARRGATVVGIDNSEQQLETARRLTTQHGIEITLLHGNAETVPRPDASFDFAISEYGAAIWCDPYVWIPETYRLLRAGGRLVFLGTHPLAIACTPESGANADSCLHRPYFGMHKTDWRNVEIDPGGIEFNLTVSDWFHLFHRTGFEIEQFLELRAPAEVHENRFAIPVEWAKQWPSEQVWKLRKPG